MDEQRNILVTGASRGIGLLTAQVLADRGHHVYASMRDVRGRNSNAASQLRAWADERGASIDIVEMDVTDTWSVNAAVEKVERARPLHVLVNNAGIMPTGTTEAFTLEQVQRTLEVNLLGVIRASRAVLPYMRERSGGRLISVSSAAGRLAIPFFGIYCASKWAMEAYCEALHYELEPFGIDSVLVEPSGHSTDLVRTSPRPEDSPRERGYGDIARGRERLLDMFETMFSEGQSITDARNVAACIADLAEAKTPCPIRTQVGHDMGVAAINAAVRPIQDELVNSLRPVYSENTASA